MDVAQLGLIILLCVNLTAVAFSYGSLSQLARNNARRLDNIEGFLGKKFDSLNDRVARLEVKIEGLSREK